MVNSIPFSDVDVKLFSPDAQAFCAVDGGASAISNILLNILMELRVHTQYLQAMNIGIVNDDPAQMRIDTFNDPSSLNLYTETSNY